MKRIIITVFFLMLSLGVYASHWHFPLYLDGGVPAKNRLQVEISNVGEIDAVGRELKISAKELGLVGKHIKSIRILSENDRELLWCVQPETKKLKKNSQFIIPVDCKVGKTTKIWVYYDICDANIVRRNRFPHGDGYFIYSGEVIGRKEIFSSVRMEVVRDGQEDYEYFILLEKLAKEKNDKLALATLEKVKSYAVYPNPGARNSTELLPNPDAYTIELRNEIASHIERLSKK